MIDKIKLAGAVALILVAVFAYYQFSDMIQLARVGMVIVGLVAAIGLTLTTVTGQSAWAFIKGANIERQKVVWPTRREALQVTLMVILLTILLGLLMWLFDSLSFYAIYDLILRVRS